MPPDLRTRLASGACSRLCPEVGNHGGAPLGEMRATEGLRSRTISDYRELVAWIPRGRAAGCQDLEEISCAVQPVTGPDGLGSHALGSERTARLGVVTRSSNWMR
jgi:hypothetical protein